VTDVDVLVTGSRGFIGTALVPALSSAGHHVVRLVRGRPTGSDELGWDPEAGTIDTAGLEGIGGVVHLAGVGIGDKRWTNARKRLILESRTRGTSLLARGLAGLTHPASVLVSASAVGYYGDRGDEVLDEQSPPGSDFVAGVCVQWEAAGAVAFGSRPLAAGSCSDARAACSLACCSRSVSALAAESHRGAST
jgi:NAD dependent epimerase/dehydratase family enzyme